MNAVNTLVLLVAAGLAVFLECTFSGFRDWFGGQVDFLPILVLYSALTADLLTVSLVALLGGLWFDALSVNPLGASSLALWVVGGTVFGLRELLLREQAFVQMLLGGAAGAATQVLSLLILWFLVHNPGPAGRPGWPSAAPLELGNGPPGLAGVTPLVGWDSFVQGAVVAALGALATPLVFRFFNRLHRAFNYPLVKESSFRPDREIKRGRSI